MYPSDFKQSLALVVGSAPDAIQVSDFEIPPHARSFAVNNAWRLRDDFDYVLFPGDFPDDRKPPASYKAEIVPATGYVPPQRRAGGVLFCGATMAFGAGYFALYKSDAPVIGFIGCDMVYTDKQSHFYGKGRPDPILNIPTTYPSVKDLWARSIRLFVWGLMHNTLLVNFSDVDGSQLAFPKAQWGDDLDRRYADIVESRKATKVLTMAQRVFMKERRVSFDRFSKILAPIAASEVHMAEIDAINLAWREVGEAMQPLLNR